MTNVNTSDEMGRVMLEATYSFRYAKRKKSWVSVRAFGGKQYLSKFDQAITGYQYSMSLSGTDGKQDLFVDEYYFGRNNLNGIWSQQRDENMGGFKSTAYYGTTSNQMVTGNVYAQIPVLSGIFGVFADFGAFWNDTYTLNTAMNVGLGMRLGNVFGIYFPVWMSKELNDSYGNSAYAEKIRFTLKFNIASKPMKLSALLN